MPPRNPAFRSVDPDTTPEVKNQYTQALIHNGIIYGSGTIPWNRERQIVGDNITDQARDFAAFEQVLREYFGEHKPARINLNNPQLPANSLVEIDFIAAVEDKK
ncbi:endoribonuclease L-PSP [Trichosporon asahii var. asahii CBS 8904]|uniref:Endoribonuclease L-PSP n=2 Tax=Trichosporon asahii var. asahii TaxID=189963 RepID=K1VGZ1_TRIAC|nr:endoribonuclease L-PSP [Trichosporon asahii var. asahii CBS 2479]EJT49515.1 endoribonuclease L-PSP [Trichosporon asahii var. asahii CBS 2479]EKC98366.1 endoribonuclease L-PSP [Trichosporon asahii var. asahii CBS 8904]